MTADNTTDPRETEFVGPVDVVAMDRIVDGLSSLPCDCPDGDPVGDRCALVTELAALWYDNARNEIERLRAAGSTVPTPDDTATKLAAIRERAAEEIADSKHAETYHAEIDNGGGVMAAQARRWAWETVVSLAAAAVGGDQPLTEICGHPNHGQPDHDCVPFNARTSVGGDLPKPDEAPACATCGHYHGRDELCLSHNRHLDRDCPGSSGVLPEQPQPDPCGPACEANHQHRQPR